MYVENILTEKMPETDIWKPMLILRRAIPVGYAAKSSAELTTETDTKRPTATA